MVVVNFSSIIRSATSGQSSVDLDIIGDVNRILKSLSDKYGESFEKRIFQNGNLRRYINVYVNGVDIRYLNLLSTEVKSSDTIDVIPAVSGG